MSRKDSKAMFDAVLGKLDDGGQDDFPALQTSSPHVRNVAAGVRQMQERSKAAEMLMQTGEQIVALDPLGIRPSPIQDRFDEAYEADAIAEMATSMRERGQVLPGLVRPVDGEPGALQIVFGRRRLAAAKELGIKFKAIVRELSDEDAAVFQGIENVEREDLSFIEKCSFALAQEDAGYKRDTICASLSTSKSHISEMISIATEIPKDLVRLIGKAPGIGRPRWSALAKKIATSGEAAWRPVLASTEFASLVSDERFDLIVKALSSKASVGRRENGKTWSSSDDAVSVTVKSNAKKAVVTYEATNGPGFADYVVGRMESLYRDFLKAKKASTGD
jgi:ParB family chromosome partitioning protein